MHRAGGRLASALWVLTLGAVLLASPLLADPARSQPFPNEDAPLGVNLSGVVDWSSAIPFTDAFRHARPWIPQLQDNSVWDTGEPLDIGANGYPASLTEGQAAGTVLITAQGGNYPEGDYVCLYDGTGQLDFRLDAHIVSSAPGRLVVHISPSADGLTHMKILATDPMDPVHNIRLVLPGYESTYETELFHPDFLASLANFRVLRFMDWMRTNNSAQSAWSGRSWPDFFSQGTERGVCVEYMVALCNELGADPWFCMPHLADDDYVTQFATYVRDHLDPELRVYVEHSNEVWNGIFSQAGYAQQRGLELGLSTNPYEAQLRYHSRRSVEIFQLWEAVFGGSDRLVRVLAAQHANPWTGTTVMDWQSAYLHADALGTAPYFGGSLGTPGNAEITRTWSVEQLLAACADEIVLERAITQQNESEASSRGLGLVAYEGGQHLVGVGGWENDATLTALFHAANRDPGMRALYLADLTGWHDAANGGVHVAFSHIGEYSKWGSWGLLERQSQDPSTAPKWMGIVDFLDSLVETSAAGDGRNPSVGTGTTREAPIVAWPNPFRGELQFAVVRGTPYEEPILVHVLGVDGRRYRTLEVDAATLRGVWDGRDDGGRLLPSGSYYLDAESTGAEGPAGPVRLVLVR
ncbi:MAG: hypothetical protein R3E97_19105 [Candidatus Eisenbacteria bacterium]